MIESYWAGSLHRDVVGDGGIVGQGDGRIVAHADRGGIPGALICAPVWIVTVMLLAEFAPVAEARGIGIGRVGRADDRAARKVVQFAQATPLARSVSEKPNAKVRTPRTTDREPRLHPAWSRRPAAGQICGAGLRGFPSFRCRTCRSWCRVPVAPYALHLRPLQTNRGRLQKS